MVRAKNYSDDSLSESISDDPGQSPLKTIEQRYQKKTQLEHILLRPDTYVGTLEPETNQAWVWDDVNCRMVFRNITYIPAMYKIFDEILVNAADVKARELYEARGSAKKKMTKIEVAIDEEFSTISVMNDGSGIPVEIHKEHGVYVPELIFGHLLTSDNYDDSDQRVTGGRNGFGAKLTNIFSEEFSVQVTDSTRRRKFEMTWTENMTKHTQPNVKSYTGPDTVIIKFKPDLKRFKTERFEEDLLALMKKRVYDIAATTKTRVSLNGQKLPIQDFKAYVDLYFMSLKLEETAIDTTPVSDEEESDAAVKIKTETPSDVSSINIVKIHEKVNERWEIIVSQSEGQFQQVSFVNSISTSKGGTHVNYVVEPLVSAILKKVMSKNKGGIEIKGHHVRNHLFVFLNCLVVNPTFDSQTKESLTLKPSQFGSVCNISEKTINAVVKSPITETVLLWAQTKEQVDLKRKMKNAGGTRRDKILGIPKLEDANDAGGRHGPHCTLILTEGDSAKTSCIAGLSVVGRDRYGVFPLRGKLLNVRDATFKQLTENKEIQNIMTIMGLEMGKKYDEHSDLKALRYGSLMIMTDQDHDGSHIKGLLINFIEHYWPSLLKHSGFLKEFVTPIVKVNKGAQSNLRSFFTIPEYEEWKKHNNNGRGWKIKYYKGLGTSQDKEFKQYFSDLQEHLLKFHYDDAEDFEAIDMAFNNKRAEDRKQWIQSFAEGTYLDHRNKVVRYKDFINKELVLFSKYDTERSIPNLMDGLKPGQRKALWAVFKKNLVKNEMKVGQLASYVADVSCYHHGEDSMAATIVNMAQNFVGSNNLNVLEPCGQFGSRKEGGKDASAARYIYTRLTAPARALFNPADDPLLHYNNEEGRVIEPRWFAPVIPLVLINGAEGIGTGWSCSIPNYNPRDIIRNLKLYVQQQPMESMTPWYRGFTGRIEKSIKLESVGIITKLNCTTLFISELPVKTWTQNYKDFLEDWLTWSLNLSRGTSAAPKVAPKAQPKAKAKAKAGAASTRAAPPTSEKAFKVQIQDFKDNSSHEAIAFTITMDEKQMSLAEAEGLDKIFRLRKPISTTNMTLFSPTGKVIRYENELDILKEFAVVRLEYYFKRKAYMLNLLEKELSMISNKLRFILAVINEEVVIQKRKKKDIVQDLVQMNYQTLKQINDLYNTINPTMVGDVPDDGVVREPDPEEEEEQTKVAGVADYDYLLTMPLLTMSFERVSSLEKEQTEKSQQLDIFKKKTPQELWTDDLNALELAIDAFEALIAKESANDTLLKKRASLPTKATTAKIPKLTVNQPTNKEPPVNSKLSGSLMERLRMMGKTSSSSEVENPIAQAFDTLMAKKRPSPSRDLSPKQTTKVSRTVPPVAQRKGRLAKRLLTVESSSEDECSSEDSEEDESSSDDEIVS